MEKIIVLGVGKLGICFALNLEKVGYEVVGVDISEDYVNSINDKSLSSFEPMVEEFLQSSENFRATTDFKEAMSVDAEMIFIAVATPTAPEGGYDHYQVERIAESIIELGPSTKKRHLVLVATTLPGYCDELAARLEPYNYTLSYNPEFIAQGNIMHDQQYPDQVLIGEANKEAGDKIEAVYREVCRNEPVFCRMDRLSAEITKLATNCFLTTKISFANSIGDLALKVGADPKKILSAIGSDSRIGGKYLNYGFGFGGPCFPRDNRALGYFSEKNDFELLISKATDEVNRRHLEFQTAQWLKDNPENEPIIFDHVTYKKGSILLEESQQLALAINLAKAGRKVIIEDQEEVIREVREIHGDLFEYRPHTAKEKA